MDNNYHTAIALLDVDRKELKSGTQTGLYTHIFLAALFTQPKGRNSSNVFGWMNE